MVEGDSYSDDEMQAIAKQVGFNETAFALKSERADLRIRYFTPGHEVICVDMLPWQRFMR